jgi:hypothetical protein
MAAAAATIEIHAQLLANRICLRVIDSARNASFPAMLDRDEAGERGRAPRIVDRLAHWLQRVRDDGCRDVCAELVL